MYAAPFEYVVATSLEEAVALLDKYGEDAKVIAGGQSLVPMMTLRLARPAYLIDIHHLAVDPIRKEDGQLVIPALTRHHVLEHSTLVREEVPLLSEAVRHIGNVRVRNRGTIGGSLAHADPAAELPCVLVALGGEVKAVGPQGERIIPAEELFVTYLTTSLERAELISEVRVPVIGPCTGWAFLEMVRRSGDFALASVAALVALDEDRRTCTDVTVVLGGVGGTPIKVEAAAHIAVGKEPDGALFEEIAEEAVRAAEPESDVHASAEYRLELVRVLTRRALRQASERARQR